MASKIEGKIREAATELFARQGYFGTSTREIALKGDITEPSIYRLFISKDRLFQDCLAIVVARSLEPAQFLLVISGQDEEADFPTLVTRAVRRWYTSLSAQSARLLMQAALSDNNDWSEMAYSRIREIIKILAKSIATADKLPRATALVAARTLILALFQFKVSRPMMGTDDGERDVVDKTIAHWLAGLNRT